MQCDCDASIGLEPLISLAGQLKFKLAAVFVVVVFPVLLLENTFAEMNDAQGTENKKLLEMCKMVPMLSKLALMMRRERFPRCECEK